MVKVGIIIFIHLFVHSGNGYWVPTVSNTHARESLDPNTRTSHRGALRSSGSNG